MNNIKVEKPENLVITGKFGSSYGIRGWLRVFSFTEQEESLFDYRPWYIKKHDKWQHVELESWKYHNQDLIVKLVGVDDRDEASLLTNNEIFVDSSLFPSLNEGNYYWKDLVGCRVVTVKGYDLGLVVELMETGSNDVLVVKANLKDAFGAKERLVPYIESQVVKKVDLQSKSIEVDWEPDF